MSDYFDRVEHQLVGRVESGLPRSRFPVRSGHLAVAASLLVVVVIGAVFVSVRGSGSTASSTGSGAIRIVFGATPLDPRAALSPSIRHSVEILRHRLESAFRGVHVSVAGSDVVGFL